MDTFGVGFGLSIISIFLRHAVVTLPKVISYSGIVLGVLIMGRSLLSPEYKPPLSAVGLVMVAAVCLLAAAYLYRNRDGGGIRLYLNAKVEAQSNLKQVCARVREISFRATGSDFKPVAYQADTLTLLWAPSGDSECKDLHKGIAAHLGLISTGSDRKYPRLAFNGRWRAYDEILKNHGTYRVKVVFSSPDIAEPEWFDVDVVSDDRWRDLSPSNVTIVESNLQSLSATIDVNSVVKDKF